MGPDELTQHILSTVDSLYKDVKTLQIRKRKCNLANLFNVMIASSFGDNNESNFKNLYETNKYISNSTCYYWKIY